MVSSIIQTGSPSTPTPSLAGVAGFRTSRAHLGMSSMAIGIWTPLVRDCKCPSLTHHLVSRSIQCILAIDYLLNDNLLAFEEDSKGFAYERFSMYIILLSFFTSH